MTTFCLVHGAWHDDACWEPLVEILRSRGHNCITPVLPLEDDDASFEDYASVVTDALPDAGEPVLVGHSMSSAVVPLVALARPARLVVYLCPAMAGFAAPDGSIQVCVQLIMPKYNMVAGSFSGERRPSSGRARS